MKRIYIYIYMFLHIENKTPTTKDRERVEAAPEPASVLLSSRQTQFVVFEFFFLFYNLQRTYSFISPPCVKLICYIKKKKTGAHLLSCYSVMWPNCDVAESCSITHASAGGTLIFA